MKKKLQRLICRALGLEDQKVILDRTASLALTHAEWIDLLHERVTALQTEQPELVSALSSIVRRHDESIIELFAGLAGTRVLIEPMLRDYQAHQAQIVAASINPLTGRPHREDKPYTIGEDPAFDAFVAAKENPAEPRPKTADELWVEQRLAAEKAGA